MNKKICILGAGGIGSCVSASMTDAGCDITLVDQWADHINKIKSILKLVLSIFYY